MKAKFRTRGSSGIKGISRVFRQLDSYDGNKQVDKEEFRVGMSECGIDLSN